ncbi:hypothetical protein ABBQ32_003337 [Trebouxia sp. C0010 RCD-2024]
MAPSKGALNLLLGKQWLRPNSVTPQITGGENANPARYPYMVSLRMQQAGTLRHYCGAPLISPSALLTAAHWAYLNATGTGEPLSNLAFPDIPRDSTNKPITSPPVVAVVAPDCSSNTGVLPQYPVFDIQYPS